MSDFLQSNQIFSDHLNNDNNNYKLFKQMLYGHPGKGHSDKTAYIAYSTEIDRKDGFNEKKRVRSGSRNRSDKMFSDQESFKKMLFGKSHTGETVHSDYSWEIKHGESFNEQNSPRGGAKSQSHSDNKFTEHEDQDRTNRPNPVRRNREKVDSSNINAFERLSSCLIRQPGKARKDHGKSCKKTNHLSHGHCPVQQSQRRTHTNFSESWSNFTEVHLNADFPVTGGAHNMVLQSHGDRFAQVDQRRREYMGIDSTTNRVSEDERMYNNLQDEAYVDQDVSAITPYLVESPDESLFNNIQDEVYVDQDVSAITPSLVESPTTFQHSLSSNDVLFSRPRTVRSAQETAREYNAKHLDGERKKKDIHNIIERKRRDNINDRIKELGTLLPREMKTRVRQNKGAVLKASVEYIKQLKKIQEPFAKMEEKIKQNEAYSKKMMSRILRIEMMMKTKCYQNACSDGHIKSNYVDVSPEVNTYSTLLASNTYPHGEYAQLDSNITSASSLTLT